MPLAKRNQRRIGYGQGKVYFRQTSSIPLIKDVALIQNLKISLKN